MQQAIKFLDNDITQNYFEIIKEAKLANRQRSDKISYHNHHILPKSLGGTNDPDNCVLLTLFEHYAVHRLLTKMLVGKARSKMAFALMRFGVDHFESDEEKRDALDEFSKLLRGKNNPFYGRKHSQKTKDLISKNHGMRGKGCYDIWVEKHGIDRANELRAKMIKKRSKSLMGTKNGAFGVPRTNAQKKSQAEKISGKNHHTFGKTYKWIKKQNLEKQVETKDAEGFLDKGWQYGRTLSAKKRKWIHKEGKNRLVLAEDIGQYLQSGWTLGRNKMPNRAKRKSC
mgnify:FL=1